MDRAGGHSTGAAVLPERWTSETGPLRQETSGNVTKQPIGQVDTCS